jgi:hypothetical protein
VVLVVGPYKDWLREIGSPNTEAMALVGVRGANVLHSNGTTTESTMPGWPSARGQGLSRHAVDLTLRGAAAVQGTQVPHLRNRQSRTYRGGRPPGRGAPPGGASRAPSSRGRFGRVG